jgi:hypothetical protein
MEPNGGVTGVQLYLMHLRVILMSQVNIAMDDDFKKVFSSAKEETEYWKGLAIKYKERLV